MLRAKEIEILIGRATGGDFMKVTHLPTGISRAVGPPLKTPETTKQALLTQIESELVERGLSDYLIAPFGRQILKSRPKK